MWVLEIFCRAEYAWVLATQSPERQGMFDAKAQRGDKTVAGLTDDSFMRRGVFGVIQTYEGRVLHIVSTIYVNGG